MSIAQLISRLTAHDTFLRLTDGDRLQLVMPAGHTLDKELMELLKVRKEEVISYLKHSAAGTSRVPVLEEQADYPCSPSQTRLWVLQQLMEDDTAAYHVSVAYRFEGIVDLPKFKKALHLLAERHEVLRTCLLIRNDQPRQRIMPEITGYFTYAELTTEETTAQLLETLQAFKDKPFQLETGPLFRIGLWKTAATGYCFLLVMHHIISDGWSIEILMEELMQYYRNTIPAGKIEKPQIQYKEYAAWLAELAATGKMQRHRNYWLDLLKGELPVLEMPTDYPRPATQSFNGKQLNYTFPNAVSDAFNELIRKQQATQFMGIVALINTLFFRYTGQEDIIVGTPIAGRPHKSFEDQVGFYVNTVVLRTNIINGDTFATLLNRTRENVLAAHEHQLYPFDKLVEEIAVHRDVSRSPVFDVMVNFQEGSYLTGTGTVAGQLKVHTLEIESKTSQFDLSFDFVANGTTLKLCVEYNTDLFTNERIEAMIQHLQSMMTAVTAQPDRALTILDYIPEAEKQQLLFDLNQHDTVLDYEHTLHGLFETQAAQHPYAPAVIHQATVLDFKTLNIAANRIAHTLLQHGLKKGQFVAVYLDRGPDVAIAILAIFKAGGVYVPIDPQNPAARIQVLMDDARPFAVITTTALMQRDQQLLQHAGSSLLINTDDDHNAMPETNPDRNIQPDDWAYMIYTSGTTGKPKGAILRHNGALNHMINEFRALELPHGFRFLQSASIVSDISVWQFVAPWMLGGACVIVDKEDLQVYDQLMTILDQQAVTFAEFVPSYFSTLLAFLERYPDSRLPLKAMKWMMLSGEEVTVEAVNKWKQLYPHINVLNAYGPTEASDDITHLLIRQPLPAGMTKVPIGRPYINLNIFLLDKQQQLVPFGYRGEITVSGIGVGVGYWQLPEKTKEVFIPNPFKGTLGDKIYRTGDLGRWLPDGNLEFGGRIDQQVKIRGFRVEVAEIESVCREHHLVQDAVIQQKRTKNGEHKLVAYLVKVDSTIDNRYFIEEIRQFLAVRLPDHMVPPLYMVMDRFPTGTSDKVDRKALPELEDIHTAEAYAPPENKIEEQLLHIWQQVLETDNIGIHSNFFENGGHSLKAIQITSRIYHDIGTRVALKDIFIHPTVKQLAAWVEQLPLEKLPELTNAPEVPYYPLSNAQQRIWISEKLYVDSMAYNMPMKYIFNGRLQLQALQRALATITERHEILRTAFVAIEEMPCQKILPAGTIPIHCNVTDMRAATDAEIATAVETLTWKPFNLESGALFRVDLVQVAEEKYLLLIVLHHIISDGWSEDIFLNELVVLYDNYCKANTPELPPLSLQYKDYAVWQRDFLESAAAEKQLNYWLRKFSGQIPLLNLPLDFPREDKKSFQAIDTRLDIKGTTAAQLKALSERTGSSLYMILLSTCYVLLYRFSNQQDLVIGSPVAARNHVKLEDQIGCYMNILPLRTFISPDMTFSSFMEQVRQNTLEAFSHQEYPFDLLLANLQIDRQENRLPLFDVGFTWLNTIGNGKVMPVYEQGDYSIAPYTEGEGTVKADSWIHAWENENGEVGMALSFNKGLFKQQTAKAMTDYLEQLITHFAADPGITIHAITEKLLNEHKNISAMNRSEAKKKNLEKFLNIQTKSPGARSIIRESLFNGGNAALKVATADMAGVNLSQWLENNRDTVTNWLSEYGGILFRGFNIDTHDRLQETANSFSDQQLNYFDQTSPRSAITGALYTSTDHPHDQVIHMHNELSYSFQWPQHIMFCCIIPAEEGGETPIADVRQVWKGLSEATRQRFRENGVKYVRNMRNGIGLSWKQVFQTDDRQKVEQHFNANGIRHEWLEDDHLRTEWTLPAVQQHPATKEEIWFNHCFFYNEHLLDETMRNVLSADGELPFNTYYGNGETVAKETIAEITAAFEAAKIVFPWEKGDVLLLDNMLMAHGRNPFKGSRKIAVAMFNPQATPAAE